MLDLDLVRSRFPSLGGDWIFFDNGGGSQIAASVLDRIRDYLLHTNVQLGASYAVSVAAAERMAEAQAGVATLVNAEHTSEVVMGPSTSALLAILAASFSETLEPGDEIVVTEGDHEANVWPWQRLEAKGAVIRVWPVDPTTGELRPQDLEPLLGPRTRLVAMTHASNILGTINPVKEIADRVHAAGALLAVDGVGFAPHRAVDVQAMDVDFYAFSFYKVFGPHHAVLYGRRSLLRALPGQSLGFIAEDDVPYKFQPGNVNYELSYGTLGLLDHLSAIVGVSEEGAAVSRTTVETAFDAIAEHEEVLAHRLLGYLTQKPGVRIVGSESSKRDVRVPIVSFVREGMSSADVVRSVDEDLVGIRFGHFYSPRLIRSIELPEDDGVVRVSMVHYNTVDEVDRLKEALERVL